MGFRSKRRAKQLPELIQKLEILRTSMAETAATGTLTPAQQEGLDVVGPKLDAHIDRAQAYLSDFEADGDIADQAFKGWFSEVDAFIVVGIAADRRARQKVATHEEPEDRSEA